MEEAEFRHLFLICGVLVAYVENYMLASPLCLEGQREAFKDLPPSAVRLMHTLLSIDPELRGTAISALASEDVLVNTAHTHGLYTFQAQLPVAVMA
ncbi:hypothetical protein CQW23_20040 [Capsicum baccatum]|uniref:Uncharacterized protein n=1 Tax=Capsicum baccatum TaxID=33114 RepID=A0A2G2W7G8_CAPBA|nr:hypothetical protein CQW23_20040 [Capsicum baccatum]